jgi:hypothetical protein
VVIQRGKKLLFHVVSLRRLSTKNNPKAGGKYDFQISFAVVIRGGLIVKAPGGA